MTLIENINRVQDVIANVCARSQRDPADITLIAVSKTYPAEAVLEVAQAGLQHFGENRVEESEIKIPLVKEGGQTALTWHMIGHIQSRKAKEVAPLFQYIQSVDTLKLASKFSALAVEQNRKLNILLEMNVSGEAAKDGFQVSNWVKDEQSKVRLWDEIRQIVALPGLNVQGLMTMAPIVEQVEQARPVFAGLAALREALRESLNIPLPHLSMGMTDDYTVAIEEGATMIRIGRAIFGERQQK